MKILFTQQLESEMKSAQTTLSRRDSLKIARRFNAGNGLNCALSPIGTAENARPFLPSLRDSIRFASPPGVEMPGYCRSSLWDKTAGASLSVERVSIAFSLTPALSLKERVNPMPSLEMAGDGIRAGGSRITEYIQALFPLPRERVRVRGRPANG